MYMVAAALVDGGIAIDTFTDGKIADPKLQDTMEKVTMNVKSKWEQEGGIVSKGVPVRITLRDGRVLAHETPREEILGGQVNPWGFDSIKGKFDVNASLILSKDRVQDTIETWSDITQVDDVAAAIRQTLVK